MLGLILLVLESVDQPIVIVVGGCNWIITDSASVLTVLSDPIVKKENIYIYYTLAEYDKE